MLAPGTRLGPYEIVSPLGAGGMGQVYRARDAKLVRDVAIKVVLDQFTDDPERVSRFHREAQLLAALNHPHIATIHGLEESNGTHFLVMELIEGDTLADLIARRAGSAEGGPAGQARRAGPFGPAGLPLDEALAIARQIADALQAAHEKGIIHRDLKPANIALTVDGQVKVLDFGLARVEEGPAKGVEAGFSPPNLTASPTLISPAIVTGVGVLLGTAAYMAPEQARGKVADKRSDIWAFGCVVYEMLTGKRPFDGEDMVDVLGAVARLEPNWAALPPDLPNPVRTLLQSCLVKDRRHRVADISTAVFVLDKSPSLAASGTPSAALLLRTPLWRRMIIPAAVALIAAVGAGGLVWVTTRPDAGRVTRTTIAPSGATAPTITDVDRSLAITPDGSRLVYVGNRGTQIFVRALDALAPVAVFTGAPRGLFVSPDGQWIGFVDGTSTLKKVAVTGGPAVTLATLDSAGPGVASRGATWAPDDTIIVASNNPATGLQRVAAAGGMPTVLTRPDRTHGEADHLWPEMLPGGQAVLFTITAVTGGLDGAQVAVLDLQTGTRTVLVRGGSHAHYAPGGHLVYAAAGTLFAVPFDLASRKTRGTPAPVIPEVVTTSAGAVDAVVAGDGTLAYVSGPAVAGAQRTLVWVDRQGRETLIQAPPHEYAHPRVSPDGTRIAVAADDQEADIWVWDLARTTLTRVTFNPGFDIYPVWTPDGRRLVFSSDRAGARNLFWQAADGTGEVERLTESPATQNATAVSPDGRRLIFTEASPKTVQGVMQVELDGTHRVAPLVQSSSTERNGIISPDGHWLAYEANDSGRLEIYVRPFPEVNSGHWQVSTAGGAQPLWARSGQELVYVSPAGALMHVGVERAPSWAATTPTLLVKEGYATILSANQTGRMYDISPDGQRFLMIRNGGGADYTAAPAQLIVVQHWNEELKRLVPTK